ncbi:unnamed protein product, partial [Brassica napus]
LLSVSFTAPNNFIQWKSSFLSYRYGHMSQLRAYDSFVRTKLMVEKYFSSAEKLLKRFKFENVRVRHFLKQTNGELTLKWSDEIDDNSVRED